MSSISLSIKVNYIPIFWFTFRKCFLGILVSLSPTVYYYFCLLSVIQILFSCKTWFRVPGMKKLKVSLSNLIERKNRENVKTLRTVNFLLYCLNKKFALTENPHLKNSTNWKIKSFEIFYWLVSYWLKSKCVNFPFTFQIFQLKCFVKSPMK